MAPRAIIFGSSTNGDEPDNVTIPCATGSTDFAVDIVISHLAKHRTVNQKGNEEHPALKITTTTSMGRYTCPGQTGDRSYLDGDWTAFLPDASVVQKAVEDYFGMEILIRQAVGEMAQTKGAFVDYGESGQWLSTTCQALGGRIEDLLWAKRPPMGGLVAKVSTEASDGTSTFTNTSFGVNRDNSGDGQPGLPLWIKMKRAGELMGCVSVLSDMEPGPSGYRQTWRIGEPQPIREEPVTDSAGGKEEASARNWTVSVVARGPQHA